MNPLIQDELKEKRKEELLGVRAAAQQDLLDGRNGYEQRLQEMIALERRAADQRVQVGDQSRFF